MFTGENIKRLAISSSKDTSLTDCGVDIRHISQLHKGSDMSICQRLMDEEIKNNKQSFISSRFTAQTEDELKDILENITAEFLNNRAEEIGLWYEGVSPTDNIEKSNGYKVYTADFSSKHIAGTTSQYNPIQGAFCIKESKDYRITLHRTNEPQYNGFKCPSVYPIKTEDKEMFYYLKLEDVFKESDYTDIQKLFFIEKNRPEIKNSKKTNIFYQVDRYTGKDEISIVKDIKSPYRFNIFITEDSVKIKLRNKETGAKPITFNYYDEAFKEKFPKTYDMITEVLSDLNHVQSNNISQLFVNRDNAGIEKANELYKKYKSFEPNKLSNTKQTPNLTQKVLK